ncbi:MAG: AmpG family muropeptide MFS transporter [Alphaproteobacteria bacterium]|nr:AmpG family muropeptide MFS transporter [Alphaproteobacteria bacterium]
MSVAEPSRTSSDKVLQTLKVYLEARVLLVLFLGFSAGLPLALSGATLLYWMAELDVDLGLIGLFSLVGTPYTVKFFWAPVVDAWKVPVFTRLLGRRRGWLVFSQVLLIVAIVMLGSLDPLTAPWWVALGAFLVALSSATQDIVIDAFRVESLDQNQQAAGMANYVAGYRVGYLLSSAGTLILVEYFQRSGVDQSLIWSYAYSLMGALILVGLIAVLLSKEPAASAAYEEKLAAEEAEGTDQLQRLWTTAYTAFADFLTKPYAIVILLFVLFFKFCDSFAGVMTGPFVVKIGFERIDYITMVKGVGFAAALLGGFAGGLLARALTLVQALWVAGILQMASNLVFAWLAWVGVNTAALGFTIMVENFTGGIGTVVFVAYLSSLTQNAAHTATQFALLTSLAAVGRTYISSVSGYIADATGWIWFFIITAIAAAPGFMLLAWLQSKGHFAQIEQEIDERKAAEAEAAGET